MCGAVAFVSVIVVVVMAYFCGVDSGAVVDVSFSVFGCS